MNDDVAGVNAELKTQARLPRAPFRQHLSNWTPGPEAAWLLGASLGLWPEYPDFASFRDKAGPRWMFSPIGNALYDCLDKLHQADQLYRELDAVTRDYRYRWKG